MRGKNRAVHFAVVLLLFLSFRDISAQTEEYEYYYEYEDSNTTPVPSGDIESTTVTLVPVAAGTSDPATEDAVSEMPLVPPPSSGSTDYETAFDGDTETAVAEETTAAVDEGTAIPVSIPAITEHPEKVDLSLLQTMRPISITTTTGNKTVTQLNGGKPVPYKTTPRPITRTTPRTNSFQMPEIVLHIYTGMYGMRKQENIRRGTSYNQRGNKSPSRNQISLGSLFESWYGSGE
ncbi:AGAP002727-PA-like protein [Anopheles sinensis]|uniref:AGAP002727-PA-like protein n=1 Tax=Anopheles sinensis TaxID=74873 RepID=A0A084VRI4_ANOSI|nr:AGAP002727-PA-like protein [Anopheles sinensis]